MQFWRKVRVVSVSRTLTGAQDGETVEDGCGREVGLARGRLGEPSYAVRTICVRAVVATSPATTT